MITIPPEVQGAIAGALVTGFFGAVYRGLRLLGWYLRERMQSTRDPKAPVSQPPDLGPLVLLVGAIGASTAAGYYAPRALDALQPRTVRKPDADRCNPAACARAGGKCQGGVCTKQAETPDERKPTPHVSEAIVVYPTTTDREPI